MINLINTNIKKYLLNIGVVYILVMISVPIWLNIVDSSFAKTANYYETYNENVELTFMIK